MMSYSSINTNKAVTGSRKKKTAVTEEEPSVIPDGYTDNETLF